MFNVENIISLSVALETTANERSSMAQHMSVIHHSGNTIRRAVGEGEELTLVDKESSQLLGFLQLEVEKRLNQ